MKGKLKVIWHIPKLYVYVGDNIDSKVGPDTVKLSIDIDEVTPKNSNLLVDLFTKLHKTVDGVPRLKNPSR